MRLALFEPDIPQNLGAFIRLAACLGAPLDIIEPCGFPLDDKRIRRAAMDYYDLARIVRHDSWDAFKRERTPGRLVLLTTSGAQRFPDVAFRTDDTLRLGRESAGVPDAVHDAADLRLRIPLQAAARSLNVALAAAMVLSEALRQTSGFDALAD
jgi:tRNA (cytidine/uridine-2'-O-)-methyltransferase